MFKTHDCDAAEDHTTEYLELASPVFNEPNDDFLVLNQPTSTQNEQNEHTELEQSDTMDRGTRRQIPISTIDWQSTNSRQVMARDGIDFLRGIDQLYIQQTVELSDLMANVNSENRYRLSVPHGETLFYAMENSSESQRMLCGSNRGFKMTMYDHTHQEALYLMRSATFGCCSFWCKMQNMEVFIPNKCIGRIKQKFSMTLPSFELYNEYNSIVYRIEGPASYMSSAKEAHFGIYSNDGLTQLGSINHQWDQVQNEYNISITFPSHRDDPKYKAIVIGAAFLLEYMYFFHTKKSGSSCWC
ncbi:phospholipid scramblase 2-like isoform X1 [Atheta coriaria]|uniref:phospholipid scramblase 2-like isoform X1 n=1 Tax=Dalotia coriaria TaxID=877792 RepID=UPI0031F3385C